MQWRSPCHSLCSQMNLQVLPAKQNRKFSIDEHVKPERKKSMFELETGEFFEPAQQLLDHLQEEMWPTKPEGRPEKPPWIWNLGVQPVMQPELHRMSQLLPSLITENLQLKQKEQSGYGVLRLLSHVLV